MLAFNAVVHPTSETQCFDPKRSRAEFRVLIPRAVGRSPRLTRGPLLRNLWHENRLETANQASVSISLSEDGSPQNAPTIHSIQGKQKALPGVFDAAFTSSDRVEVTLREEACGRELRTPRRRTQDRVASPVGTTACSLERKIRRFPWISRWKQPSAGEPI